MLANFVLSSSFETNIFSDSFGIFTDQGEVIFTSDEQIVALSGTSKRFQFATITKKLVTVDHYKVVSTQQMQHHVARFNSRFGFPFATRDGHMQNQQLESVYTRQVSLTSASGCAIGDRDGMLIEFDSPEFRRIERIEPYGACILGIQGDFVFTTRSVFENGKQIYGPSDRLDGGVQLEEDVYVVNGDSVVEVTSGCTYYFECLPRISKSVPQLQIGIFCGALLIFSNTGGVFNLDGSQWRDLTFYRITQQQARQAWFVSEPYANYEEKQ